MSKRHDFNDFMENFKELGDKYVADSLVRRKKDGSLYRGRHQIIEEYNKSKIPYPLAALIKLDYCRNTFISNMKNCIFFSGPLSLVTLYALNADVRKSGYRAKGFLYNFSHFILITLIMMGAMTLDCLILNDYCNPNSDIYKMENDSEYFKKALLPKLIREKNKLDVKIGRTKEIGLKDEEL